MQQKKIPSYSIVLVIISFITLFVASCFLTSVIQAKVHGMEDMDMTSTQTLSHGHLAIPMTVPEPLSIPLNIALLTFVFGFFILQTISHEDIQFVRQRYRKRTLFPILTSEYLFLFQKGILNGKSF